MTIHTPYTRLHTPMHTCTHLCTPAHTCAHPHTFVLFESFVPFANKLKAKLNPDIGKVLKKSSRKKERRKKEGKSRS